MSLFRQNPREGNNLKTVYLLVADVLEALPHPLHLVAQLVLLLQRMHPLFQVNLPPAQTSVKVETIGGRKVVVAKSNSLTVFYLQSLVALGEQLVHCR